MYRYFLSLFFVAILFSGCNTHKDKDLFDTAEKSFSEKKYSDALRDYQRIIDEYSTTEFAEKSLFKVGSIYQMFLIPNVSAQKSNEKAVEYYRLLFKNFPKSTNAAKAIFMSGFILANNLNKLDEARLTYSTFLEKFPNDPLAPQVKVELDNLGKTPEEILQSRLGKK